ncbi:pH-response regulator protein palA/RIM20, putative [Entamoeba invadens IP1]|uniref:pH-response regulator protein palA/RIM20, putative n=1 Tax=Entamoeba invadens IP1 TaxID=370355 RepID=A0A0A1UDQ9_ENTIV|nr:pH-response regulator protein palA/RIM20, putative [Entamoeba invadens IP1]ELP94740.1 pH-response regulator protein palA/RIM20, putative [Entamoeba invadens IP1]|eukprot:XP_004261511.1 pH-response regulator protein palA/RIM20, putative [Entamoeba invadens IP1]
MEHQFMPDFPIVPMRKSDAVDVTFACTQAMNGCLLEKNALSALQSLTSLRKEATSHEFSQSHRDACWKYIEILSQIWSKAQIHLNFVWYDTYLVDDKKPVKYTSSSLDFEKANILYNMACSDMALAASFTKSSSADSLKSAVQIFQQAADAYQKCLDASQISAQNKGDLSPKRLQTLVTMALGCAHLVMHINASTQGKSEAIQLKLAVGAMNQLKPSVEAFKAFYGLGVTYNFISNFVAIKNYAIYCAQSLAAEQCVPKLEYGEQIARLQLAVQALDRAASISYNSASKGALKKMHTELNARLKEATKANNDIYMQSIPDEKALAALPEILAAKPIEMEKLPDIFGSILPANMSSALNEYNSKVGVIMNDTRMVCGTKNSEGEAFCKQVCGNGQIPQDLMNRIAQINSTNVCASISSQLPVVKKMDLETVTLFEKAITSLDSENAEERRLKGQYGYQWVRTPSEQAALNYRKDAEKFRIALKQAQDIDKEIERKYGVINTQMQIAQSAKATPQTNPEEVVKKWKDIEERRRKALNTMEEIYLKNEKDKINVIKGGNGSQAAVLSLLNEFNEPKGQIQQTLFDQDMLIKQNRTTSSIDVAALRNALNSIDEVMKTLEQSFQFHKDAQIKIAEFQRTCNEFQESRQQEAMRMVQQLSNGTIYQQGQQQAQQFTPHQFQIPQQQQQQQYKQYPQQQYQQQSQQQYNPNPYGQQQTQFKTNPYTVDTQQRQNSYAQAPQQNYQQQQPTYGQAPQPYGQQQPQQQYGQYQQPGYQPYQPYGQQGNFPHL